jgi:hypothetical protein
LETCAFKYQQVTYVASSLQAVVFDCILNKGQLSETGLSEKVCQEVLHSLVHAGLLLKKNNALAPQKQHQMRRVARIHTLTLGFPTKFEECSPEEIFQRRRPKIESSIARMLKSKGPQTIQELFRGAQHFYNFPMKMDEFKECLDLLMAKNLVFKGFDSRYRICDED